MSSRSRLGLVSVFLAVALALSGCATASSGASQAETSPGGIPSASPSPSATSTAACPEPVHDGPRDPGCAYYDPDAAMNLNEAYRERFAPTEPEDTALLQRVREALEPFATGEVRITKDAVSDALAAAGLDADKLTIQGDPPYPAGVAFGTSVPGGCVFGGVRPDQPAAVQYDGAIRDGGCLPAPGH
jgi:hypothetical protein